MDQKGTGRRWWGREEFCLLVMNLTNFLVMRFLQFRKKHMILKSFSRDRASMSISWIKTLGPGVDLVVELVKNDVCSYRTRNMFIMRIFPSPYAIDFLDRLGILCLRSIDLRITIQSDVR